MDGIGGIDRYAVNSAFGSRGCGPFKDSLASDFAPGVNMTGIFRYTAYKSYCVQLKKKRNIQYYYLGLEGSRPSHGMPKTVDFPDLASDACFVSTQATRSEAKSDQLHNNNYKDEMKEVDKIIKKRLKVNIIIRINYFHL